MKAPRSPARSSSASVSTLPAIAGPGVSCAACNPTQTGPDSFRIEGFPDGVKVITVDGAMGRRLGHLALHRSDLEFARLCLDAIERAPPVQEVLRTALWRSGRAPSCTTPSASANQRVDSDSNPIRCTRVALRRCGWHSNSLSHSATSQQAHRP